MFLNSQCVNCCLGIGTKLNSTRAACGFASFGRQDLFFFDELRNPFDLESRMLWLAHTPS